MAGIDPTLLQTATEFTATAHDVTIGPVAFNYPWGDNLADEGLVGAVIYLVKTAINEWAKVESDRAVFGHDPDDP